MKLLLDTNVLADFYLQREEFSKDVNSMVIAGIYGDVELWASAKSYTDIFYVGQKYFASDALQKSFRESFEFINICSIEKDDLVAAADKCWSDFEDCLICEAALKVNADFIVTRDEKGFDSSSIKAISPNAVVKILSEKGLHYEIC